MESWTNAEEEFDAPKEQEPVSPYPNTLPTVIVMTVQEWAAVPGNPHQRDTDRHLATAAHLRSPSLAHLQMNAARLPDGDGRR